MLWRTFFSCIIRGPLIERAHLLLHSPLNPLLMPVKNKPIPGPTDLLTFQALFSYYRDAIQTFENLRETYGDIFQLKFWKYHIIHLSHPDDIRAVLCDPNFEISTVFSPAQPLIGKGLATNTGEDWACQRQMVQPAFHDESVAHYLETIEEETQRMLARWEVYAETQQPFDLVKELVALNHAQLYRLLFRERLSPENEKFLEALQFARTYTYQRAISLVAPPASWPNPTMRRFDQVVEALNQYTYEVIRKSRTAPLERKDVLANLIHARDISTGQGMSDEQIHDELMTMFFSAYEDVANVLAWAFYLLAQHPEVASAAHDETSQTFSQSPLTLQVLQHLPSVANIIAETLRLYPPTWSSLRVAKTKTKLRGYLIPQGAVTMLNVYLLHRHPDYWEEPNQFDPGRFSAGKPSPVNSPAYLPFGSPPRDCIGDSLALAQLRTNLALIIQKFRVIPQPGSRVGIDTDATLRMRGRLFVTLANW